MRIFVDLMLHHVQMMRVTNKLHGNTRTPKKKDVIWQCVHDYLPGSHRQHPLSTKAGAGRAFSELVACGVIEHSRNGHCWLTDKGTQALLGERKRG